MIQMVGKRVADWLSLEIRIKECESAMSVHGAGHNSQSHSTDKRNKISPQKLSFHVPHTGTLRTCSQDQGHLCEIDAGSASRRGLQFFFVINKGPGKHVTLALNSVH